MTPQERKDFMETAMPVVVVIGEEQVVLTQKTFSTGSVGWHGNTKMTVHSCRCQCNILLTVVGSKEMPPPEQKNTTAGKPPSVPQEASEHKSDSEHADHPKKSRKGH